jgi:hypothetical protein
MGSITEVFGRSPRVRLLEALLALAPTSFTVPEMAVAAQMHKPSAYRALPGLLESGMVTSLTGSRPKRYVVPERSPRIQALNYLESTLNLLDSSDLERGDRANEIVDVLRDRLHSLVGESRGLRPELRAVIDWSKFPNPDPSEPVDPASHLPAGETFHFGRTWIDVSLRSISEDLAVGIPALGFAGSHAPDRAQGRLRVFHPTVSSSQVSQGESEAREAA